MKKIIQEEYERRKIDGKTFLQSATNIRMENISYFYILATINGSLLLLIIVIGHYMTPGEAAAAAAALTYAPQQNSSKWYKNKCSCRK